jgi:hypothetical protein
VCEADAGAEIRNHTATTQTPWHFLRTSVEEFNEGIHDHLLVPQNSLQYLFLFFRHI